MNPEQRSNIINKIAYLLVEEPNLPVNVALLANVARCSVGDMVEALTQTRRVVQRGDHYFTPHQQVPDYGADDLFADIGGRGYFDTSIQNRHQPLDDESRWGDD